MSPARAAKVCLKSYTATQFCCLGQRISVRSSARDPGLGLRTRLQKKKHRSHPQEDYNVMVPVIVSGTARERELARYRCEGG